MHCELRARKIIADNDLIAALDSGKVAAAALDVFTTEPLPAEHPFRKHPGITLTPHLGASTAEAQENAASKWRKSLLPICSPAKFAML